VRLVPFSSQYLRADRPLPFGVRDASGQLLLAAGQVVENQEQLATLKAQPLFSDEAESAEWTRRLAAAMDAMIRKGATLNEVAAARPEPDDRNSRKTIERRLDEQWDDLVLTLDTTLRDVREDSPWRTRLATVHDRARELVSRKPDASLYLLVYAAGQITHQYSSHHALVSLAMCELAASVLEWPQAEIDSLGRAALTMNVAMAALQDQLAVSDRPLTPAMREEIDAHPEVGATLLAEAGLGDPLAVEVVRAHHDDSVAAQPLAALPPAARLARLLRRVDIFSAKISKRGSRKPQSPVQAAREACLGPDGKPDEIGSALLKAVGMYPPGSFVELNCGELGIVLARGRRANLPHVATLVSGSGTVLVTPALRDTIEQRFSVKNALAPHAVRVRPPHERLLAMR
jgi:HD-GYP domain-containing protein (c-di-GMP phosphodiesterase class II)